MNNTYDIVKMLENSGLRVLGADGEFVHIEDPGCIMRGFENFLENAWIVLALATGALIMVWGIAMIRGGKNDITNSFKTLILILGILTAIGPILNLIYGDDLFGIGCKEMKVAMSQVDSLVATKLAASTDSKLYEDIDIYDSGALPFPEPELPDVSVLEDTEIPDVDTAAEQN